MGAYEKQSATVKKAGTEIINIVSPFLSRSITDSAFFSIEDKILKVLKSIEDKYEENRIGTAQDNSAELRATDGSGYVCDVKRPDKPVQVETQRFL